MLTKLVQYSQLPFIPYGQQELHKQGVPMRPIMEEYQHPIDTYFPGVYQKVMSMKLKFHFCVTDIYLWDHDILNRNT